MIVIDTSVVFKWLIREQDSALADRLLGQEMIAPDLILLKCGNAVWKRARRNEVNPLAASESLAIVERFVSLVGTGPLAGRALEIGLALDHAVYDCVFLALAEREAIPLVTADAKFLNKVRAAALPVTVTLLADWQPAAS